MEKILYNKYLILFFRLIVGFVFIYASLWKITDPESFAKSIENYQLIPVAIVNIVALILPWLELILGLFIILGVFVKATSFLLSVVMGFFTILILSAIFRNLDASCGCFSATSNSVKIGWYKFFENLSLTLLSVLIYLSSELSFTLEKYFRNKKYN